MHVVRTFRMAATVVAAVLAVGTLGATAAEAKPAPAPTGLAATVSGHQNGSFDVAASWNAVANATSYRVALTKGGATLSSATVNTTSWKPTVTTTPGNASLSVRALVGKRPGRTATRTVPLPDVVAPQGSYTSTWDNNTGDATITEDALTDNSPSPASPGRWTGATGLRWPGRPEPRSRTPTRWSRSATSPTRHARGCRSQRDAWSTCRRSSSWTPEAPTGTFTVGALRRAGPRSPR